MYSSIETLPVELLHRIFDNLDPETIIFSIRSVCRSFQSIVNTYNRYTLDFNLISKSTFYILCRLINPENVISLTLSNDDRTSNQIDLFISLVHLPLFTQLRSLSLHNINESQLNIILKAVNLQFLTSFSINIEEDCDQLQKTSINLLSSVFAQPTLRKINTSLKYGTIWDITWPNNCTIQYLTINKDISIHTFCKILQACPYAHTISMKDIPTGMINSSTPIDFRQLTSLNIEGFDGIIDKLESFLLMVPSLVYLKLIGGQKMMDGKRWEEFIERNLSQLKTFEFYFQTPKLTKQTLVDLELIISSFQTPFWIEHKQWFVTGEYHNKWPTIIDLYSIPICKSFLQYEPDSLKTSLSTYPMMNDTDQSIMNHITSISLNWNKTIVDHLQKRATDFQKLIGNHLLFPKVTEIDIEFWEDWTSSLQSLSIIVDISRIVQIKIDSYYNENNRRDIAILLKQAFNLSSLIIQGPYSTNILEHILITNDRIIPRHIKHLEMSINNLNQINTILERCESLSTIKFGTKDIELSKNVIKWFAENTMNTTCREDNTGMIAVWLGKKRILFMEPELKYF